jgi:hypothetical protein
LMARRYDALPSTCLAMLLAAITASARRLTSNINLNLHAGDFLILPSA